MQNGTHMRRPFSFTEVHRGVRGNLSSKVGAGTKDKDSRKQERMVPELFLKSSPCKSATCGVIF